MQTIGERIKRLREDVDMSQGELAKKLGIHQNCLGGWERGEYIPRVYALWDIADIFNVSLDELVGRKYGEK